MHHLRSGGFLNNAVLLTLLEVAGSSRADITEVADRFLDPLTLFTEVVERCLEAFMLAGVVPLDAVDLMDVVDGVFAPVTEAADLMEVSEMAFSALPTEVVDILLEVIDWTEATFCVPATEVVETGSFIRPALSCWAKPNT